MQPNSRPIILLTDIPTWVEGLQAALLSQGCCVEVVDVTNLRWEPSHKLPWSEHLIFNRVSAHTAGGRVSSLTKTRDLLAALDVAGARVINGLFCQLVASSKALQSAIFAHAGVMTPPTELLEHQQAWSLGQLPRLAKPNVSGFGQGIALLTNESPLPYSEDGCAILQEYIKSGDQKVHRVEILDERVLYRSTSPLVAGQFDYCLAGVEQVELFPDCPRDLEKDVLRIAQLAKMEVGSIEYLIDQDEEAHFIDINPVSSYSPRTEELLGFSPLEKLVDLLKNHPD